MSQNKKQTEIQAYVNRELSWIEFNKRILGEARSKEVRLFERLKFLGITASNLDEFYMVRVASLKDMQNAGYTKSDIAGMRVEEQLEAISLENHCFIEQQYAIFNRSLKPMLEKAGLRIIGSHEDLEEGEKEYVDRYFKDNVYPVLTPMAVDASRPFPLIRNKTLNIAALLKRREDTKGFMGCKNTDEAGRKKPGKGKGEKYKGYAGEGLDFAVVQVPSVLPRLVEIPPKYSAARQGIKKTLILLEELIEKNIEKLFLNYTVLAAHPFRIMRNAEFELDEEDAADLLVEIKKQLKRRQWGEAIRLEVEEGINKKLLKILRQELNIGEADLFKIRGPLDLTVLLKIYETKGFEELKNPAHIPRMHPRLANQESIFENIKKGDILLSHPYHSFDPVVDFIQKAASDPDVLAIKQTLYRVSGNSPIVAALAQAADNKKQVCVLVELKARFDEENNILWAKKLEKAGCHVIYGLVGLKTHSKITLVLRKEEDGIRRYVHLGTGNYNDTTAKFYTDFGLLSCRRDFGEDANAVFNMLSGYSEPLSWNEFIVAPLWMKERFLYKIDKAREAALRGERARIIAKMNSLSDKEIIKALYRASEAGVKIDLIVRGICCLRAGVGNLSENIEVRSIVGNFLEHARVFYFHYGDSEEYYLGSADWMNRNLEKRVEIVFPVLDEELRARLKHYLEVQLEDNVKAYRYMPDNSYEKADLRGKTRVNAQEQFVREAEAEAAGSEKSGGAVRESRIFSPIRDYNSVDKSK